MVANGSMSLELFNFVAPDEFSENAAASGANTHRPAKLPDRRRMEAEKPGRTDHSE